MKNKKEHPLTFFRKANEARQKLVKKSFGGPSLGHDNISILLNLSPKVLN